mgnify:CR=1 FL=1
MTSRQFLIRDVLVLLAFAGWDVTREYYVNDAGRQMDILAISTWIRYLDQHGVTVDYPPNAYQGDYVRQMARQLTNAHGDKYVRARTAVLADTPGLPPADWADDEAKAQRELGWHATRDLAAMCADSWRWQSANPNGYEE